MARDTMTIGQAAHAAGLTRKAVRLYEAKGLLSPAERTAAGYRLYTPGDVKLLTFIRRARTLGLHLDDLADVLAIRHRGARPCSAVRGLLEARLAEIDAAVADLLALRQSLAETRQAADQAHSDDTMVCSIIEKGAYCCVSPVVNIERHCRR